MVLMLSPFNSLVSAAVLKFTEDEAVCRSRICIFPCRSYSRDRCCRLCPNRCLRPAPCRGTNEPQRYLANCSNKHYGSGGRGSASDTDNKQYLLAVCHYVWN